MFFIKKSDINIYKPQSSRAVGSVGKLGLVRLGFS